MQELPAPSLGWNHPSPAWFQNPPSPQPRSGHTLGVGHRSQAEAAKHLGTSGPCHPHRQAHGPGHPAPPGARARQAALPRAVPTHLRPRSCPRPRPRPRCRRRRPPPRAAPRSALTSRRPARRRRSRLGTARTAPRCSPRVASQWESSASRASRRPADRRWGKVCG